MIKVMLLGDSIRMNYQDKVTEDLGDSYEVWGPDDNGRFSKYTLNRLRLWFMQFPGPDIIHWNNGLWDIDAGYPEYGCFTSIDEYIRDMTRILEQLRKTGARVIFATTTPTLPQFGSICDANIREYNRRIVSVMEKEKVAVNDLYELVFPNVHEYIRDDYIHLSQAGIEACGKAVAGMIRKTAADIIKSS